MINCQTARRYLYAFADGELSVKDNCEVLDHLKMCPHCARIASDQQHLRTAVRRTALAAPVPAGLAERVRRSIDPTRAAPGRSARPARPRWIAWAVPMAAAASIALMSFTLWQSLRPIPSEDPPSADFVNRGGSAASHVVDVHAECCRRADAHQHPDLPHDRVQVASALTRHYEDRITALAPDLSEFGFRFESANFCGLQPDQPGGHILYVADNAQRFSFFSVPRWQSLDGQSDAKLTLASRDRWRTFEVEHGDDQYAVVAWHDDETTYVCCATLPARDMMRMVNSARMAMARFAGGYAMLWHDASSGR